MLSNIGSDFSSLHVSLFLLYSSKWIRCSREFLYCGSNFVLTSCLLMSNSHSHRKLWVKLRYYTLLFLDVYSFKIVFITPVTFRHLRISEAVNRLESVGR
jgi:hypothetical protein